MRDKAPISRVKILFVMSVYEYRLLLRCANIMFFLHIERFFIDVFRFFLWPSRYYLGLFYVYKECNKAFGKKLLTKRFVTF